MNDFTDKFIAYVDILGFAKLVADAERGEGLPLAEILELLPRLGTGNERKRFETHGPACCPCAPYIQKHLDFRLTQISDCVIVSAEVSPAGVINLISHCWGAVIELLHRGMCRGYIKRGTIYHTDTQVIGTGYQDAYLAEGRVGVFKREADERGTPYVEVDPEVTTYVDAQDDACVREMFARMAKREANTVALFPFQRLAHSFIVAGFGHKFDAAKERRSNQNLRAMIHLMKERVRLFVDANNASALAKAAHYLAALDTQLQVCDKTDEFIETLERPFSSRRKE